MAEDDESSMSEDEIVRMEAGLEKSSPLPTNDIDCPFDVAQFNLDLIKEFQQLELKGLYDAGDEDVIKLITGSVKVIIEVQKGMEKKYKNKPL
jgi:hypothetical protein